MFLLYRVEEAVSGSNSAETYLFLQDGRMLLASLKKIYKREECFLHWMKDGFSLSTLKSSEIFLLSATKSLQTSPPDK